jgi:hypothetical protein
MVFRPSRSYEADRLAVAMIEQEKVGLRTLCTWAISSRG